MNQIFILNPPFILRRELSLRLKLSLRIFWILVFISIISFSVFYIFQINSLTREKYLLKEQERKLVEIKKEREILEINFAKVNSLVNLETYFQTHDFKKTNQIKYIQILESPVVSK